MTRQEARAAKSYVRTCIRLAMDVMKEARVYPEYYDSCRDRFNHLLSQAAIFQRNINIYEAKNGRYSDYSRGQDMANIARADHSAI